MTNLTQNLNNFKMNTLVSMVNALGGAATMKTFSQRSKAVARLEKLANDQKVDLNSFFDADGNKRVVEVKSEKAPKAVKAPKAPKEPKEKKISIRSVAEALIAKVVTAGEDGKAVGLSYEDVLAEIKSQFPAAKTTVGCLRWYAVRMREANVELPNRPRAVKAVAPVVVQEPTETVAETPVVEAAEVVAAETETVAV